MGEARVPGAGRAVPVASSGRRRPGERQRRKAEGAGSVGPQLREVAVDKYSFQPSGHTPVFRADDPGDWAGDSVDKKRANELGRGDQAGNRGCDSADVYATE